MKIEMHFELPAKADNEICLVFRWIGDFLRLETIKKSRKTVDERWLNIDEVNLIINVLSNFVRTYTEHHALGKRCG